MELLNNKKMHFHKSSLFHRNLDVTYLKVLKKLKSHDYNSLVSQKEAGSAQHVKTTISLVEWNATDARKINLLLILKASLFTLFVKNNNNLSITWAIQRNLFTSHYTKKTRSGTGYVIIVKTLTFDSDRSAIDVRSLRIIFISKLFN